MDDRRLNKYLADSGYCSRRQADRLIAAGEVTINGRVVARLEAWARQQQEFANPATNR